MKLTKIPDIAEVAREQWGMLTSRQAAQVGVDPRTLARLAATGEVERLGHGIYRLAGTPRSPHDDLRVAWLSFEPERTAYERISSGRTEVVSHRSAAVLHGLGDIDADVLEFSAPVRRQTRRPDVVIHRANVPDEDWQLWDGLPVTTPLRTIGDLAAANIDQGHLASAVRDTIAQYDVPVSRISSILDPSARRYLVAAGHGRQLVDRLLSQAGVPRSALELAVHADPEARRSLLVALMRTVEMSDGPETTGSEDFVNYLIHALKRRDSDLPDEMRVWYLSALASVASASPAASAALLDLTGIRTDRY